jgi:iron complex outermembrane receptor protein
MAGGKVSISRLRLGGTGAAAIALLAAWPPHQAAHAQSAAPGSAVVLAPVEVEGRGGVGAATRERIEALPGGATFIDTGTLDDKANVTLSDSLGATPGVIVQDFFGGNDQPRVQIRGSGLQQNPVERGILVLQDGLPLNRADGSYIVGFADPRQAAFAEIYRGYTANRLGATVLGGALNFTSPTGSSAPGARAGVEGGSFGQLTATAQAGAREGNFDGLVQLSHSSRDGFRDYNDSERFGLNANFGAQLRPDINTRFFAGHTRLDFDVAGPLSKSLLKSDPERVFGGPTFVPGPPPSARNPGPNVLRDRPRREATQSRAGNRTTFEDGPHLFDLALGYSYTDDTFRFPVSSGIRTTEGGDLNAVLRYAYSPNESEPLPLFETTVGYVIGSADRRYYLNRAGNQGALLGANELDASTLSVSTGLNMPLGMGFTLSPAVAYARATRDNDDVFGAATRPTLAFNPANPTQALPNGAIAADDTSYARTYSGISPSLGLSYRPNKDQMFFGAVSRSFEPPTHDDLIATVNGTPNSSPGRPTPGNPNLASTAFRTPDLDAQTATTVELGWRGRLSPLTFDAVIYHSWIENELLSLRDQSGAPLGAVDADKTRHLGLELGVSAALTDKLSGRVAYTFQDFRFDDDPVRGDNRLAGAPRHVIGLAAQYAVTEQFRLLTDIQWSPAKTPVDNMNTLYADPYVVVDLGAAYTLNERFALFGEVRNVLDERYASSTLIVDQAQSDQAAFLPADGRAFIVGFKATF